MRLFQLPVAFMQAFRTERTRRIVRKELAKCIVLGSKMPL